MDPTWLGLIDLRYDLAEHELSLVPGLTSSYGESCELDILA